MQERNENKFISLPIANGTQVRCFGLWLGKSEWFHLTLTDDRSYTLWSTLRETNVVRYFNFYRQNSLHKSLISCFVSLFPFSRAATASTAIEQSQRCQHLNRSLWSMINGSNVAVSEIFLDFSSFSVDAKKSKGRTGIVSLDVTTQFVWKKKWN